MRNDTIYGTLDLIDRFASALRDIGPRNTENRLEVRTATDGVDAVIDWRVAGQDFTILVQAKVTPESRADVVGRRTDKLLVVLSPYFSRPAQMQLENAGLSYWDPTGNLLLQNRAPFLWVKQEGASKNPVVDSQSTALRSLKGRSASEIMVRLLSEGRAPTARDLARSTGVGLGTASRVVTLLKAENFFMPTGGGPLVIQDPVRLARRWAEDYSFEKTYKATRYYSVLGPEQALVEIKRSGAEYALTGLAALALDYRDRLSTSPLPATDLWLYTDNVDAIQRTADLVPDNRNGNILVAQTDFFDSGREGYRPIGDARTAWPWRIAGDLLSARGRHASAGLDLAEDLARRQPGPYA